jgi:hypothetical protein
MRKCLKCGQETADDNARFCGFCGAEHQEGASGAAEGSGDQTGSLDDTQAFDQGGAPTIRIKSPLDSAQYAAPEMAPPAAPYKAPMQEQPPAGYPPVAPQVPSTGGMGPGKTARSPWVSKGLPRLAGLLFLLLVGGAAYALTRNNGPDSPDASAPPVGSSGTGSTTSTRPRTTTTGTTGTTGTTDTTGGTSTASYVSSMDSFIASNSTKEQQIRSLATTINQTGPNISSSTISQVSSLKNDFSTMKSQVNSLSTPTGFSQAEAEFVSLLDYNITRCDAMYNGATAWKSSGSKNADSSLFMPGQTAKEAYDKLYPTFQSDWASAKSGH